jgi:hypothetical protein
MRVARPLTEAVLVAEDVLVKKTHKGEDFELRLVESTVKSVRFDVEKE